MMKSVYLNTMPMSSISPAGRRQCHQIMRKVNKYINQIPMPNCIRIRVRPTLHKFIISIPSLHVMANQNPRPLRQSSASAAGRQLHRRLIERVMKRFKVGTRLQFLERFERVRNWNRRLRRINRWRVGGGGWGVIGDGVFHYCGEEETDVFQGGEGFGMVGFEVGDEGHLWRWWWVENPLTLTWFSVFKSLEDFVLQIWR